MAKSIIRNVSGASLTLTEPYGSAILGPGSSRIVEEDSETTIARLGGAAAVAEANIDVVDTGDSDTVDLSLTGSIGRPRDNVVWAPGDAEDNENRYKVWADALVAAQDARTNLVIETVGGLPGGGGGLAIIPAGTYSLFEFGIELIGSKKSPFQTVILADGVFFTAPFHINSLGAMTVLHSNTTGPNINLGINLAIMRVGLLELGLTEIRAAGPGVEPFIEINGGFLACVTSPNGGFGDNTSPGVPVPVNPSPSFRVNSGFPFGGTLLYSMAGGGICAENNFSGNGILNVSVTKSPHESSFSTKWPAFSGVRASSSVYSERTIIPAVFVAGLSVSTSLTYVADNGDGNSEITGADFSSFKFGDVVDVSGTASNNGTYKVLEGTSTELVLVGLVLTDEGPVASTVDTDTTNANYNETVRVDTATNTAPATIRLPQAGPIARAGQTVEVIDDEGSADVDAITVVPFSVSETASFEYVADGGSGDSEIRRAAGSFIDQDFTNNLSVTISGTVSNNGTFAVKTLTDTALVLSGSVLTNEGPLSSTLDQSNTMNGGASSEVMAGSRGARKYRTDGVEFHAIAEVVGAAPAYTPTNVSASRTFDADGVVAFTNNITTGGTNDQADDWTDLTTYSTDAAAIRNASHQMARKIDQLQSQQATLADALGTLIADLQAGKLLK